MPPKTKVQAGDHKVQKLEWVEPRVHRFDARDAESSHGAVPDGGGGFQGS